MKAFDSVCHAKLFIKLIERKLPYVVLYLVNLYSTQYCRVCWNSAFSDSFSLFNWDELGGISSPILFCVYIDKLLRRLQYANIGCFIGNVYAGALA
jgi:hypothetical protein